MRILITGATGLVGQALVAQLHKQGHDIHYLTTSKQKIIQKEHYKGFYWNPKTGEIDTSCFDEVAVLIHLAGANVAKRWTSSYKKEILESRVKSTELLIDSLQNTKHSIHQVIAASAIGIYEDALAAIYREDSESFSGSFLGKVVAEWERATRQFNSLKVLVCQVRIGIVLSPKGGALVKMADPIKKGFGAVIGNGKQWQSWIYITDLVRAIQYIIVHKSSGILNLTAPNPVTNSTLTKQIAQYHNKKIRLPGIPKLMMHIILGEMHQILFESQHVLPHGLLHSGFEFQFGSLPQVFQDLDKH
jgi:hypothetical protein